LLDQLIEPLDDSFVLLGRRGMVDTQRAFLQRLYGCPQLADHILVVRSRRRQLGQQAYHFVQAGLDLIENSGVVPTWGRIELVSQSGQQLVKADVEFGEQLPVG
jgi:hypothetical protein